jgi:hypothetical protein
LNSTWHPLQALFSFSFLVPTGLRPLNGLLLVLVLAQGFASVIALARGDMRPSRLMSAALILPALFYFQRFISSPVTDTPAVLIAWLIWVAVLGRQERGKGPKVDRETAALVGIAVFLVTIKFSALPILLVVLIALGKPWRMRSSELGLLSALAAIILVPWVAHSVVLSGAMLFPLPWLPPLPVDWALASEDVLRGQYDWTVSWSRIPGRNPDEVLALSTLEWGPVWWAALSAQHQGILALLILAPVIFVLLLPRSWRMLRRVLPAPGTYVLPLLAGYAGLGYWFFTAPDLRFGLGSIVPTTILVIVPLVMAFHELTPRIARGVMLLGLGLAPLTSLPGHLDDLVRLARTDRLLLPADHPGSTTRLQLLNGVPVLMPQSGDQCWNAPLPCTPSIPPGLILRCCAREAGFRVSASPDRERRADCPPRASVVRLQLLRRGLEWDDEINCDADRQNMLRVLVRNEGQPRGSLAASFYLDGAEIERLTLSDLSAEEERWIELSSALRPRKGTHVLRVSINGSGDEMDKRAVEFVCT